MSNPYFSFKRFTVRQPRSAMKVGTDGVLLGAWCRLPAVCASCEDASVSSSGPNGEPGRSSAAAPPRLLDIGTGTGLIALMLAQRTELRDAEGGHPAARPAAPRIDAIEPDPGACEDAAANFAASPWAERLSLHRTTLQEYEAEPYDCIVSNPPYFVDSLLPPDPSRSRARHAATLPFDDLLDGVVRLLGPDGIFSLILPVEAGEQFARRAQQSGLLLRRRTELCSTPRQGAIRVLTEWGRNPGDARQQPPLCDTLLIHPAGDNAFGEAYRALTREFYLHF